MLRIITFKKMTSKNIFVKSVIIYIEFSTHKITFKKVSTKSINKALNRKMVFTRKSRLYVMNK